MSRTENGATTASSTHQSSVGKGVYSFCFKDLDCFTDLEIESSFIPFALLIFIGLAGITAWLGQVCISKASECRRKLTM